MCSFEAEILFKSTKNTLLTLQTKRHYFFACILIVGLAGHFIYGQNPVNQTPIHSTIIPFKIQDSLKTEEINPILDTIPQDSIANDTTLISKKEAIDDIIDYYGKDYVYLDREVNKVYMYNEAFITYENMRIDAGLIIMDLD